MKYFLKAIRNFFIIFAIFVVMAIVLSKSQSAREFVTPKGQFDGAQPEGAPAVNN